MSDQPGQPPDEAVRIHDKDLGTWDIEFEIRPGPSQTAITTTGTAINRRVAGRGLVTDHTTESGFDGHGIYGWDPAQQAYVGVWVDSGGAGIARGVGTWDDDSRTMTFEVAHEGQTLRYRELTQTREDGSKLYRNLMSPPGGGDEFEVITATYRRRAE